jgi:hypothetical protein
MGTWDEQFLHHRMLPGLGQDPHQKPKIENIASVRIHRQMREQALRELELSNDLTAIMF